MGDTQRGKTPRYAELAEQAPDQKAEDIANDNPWNEVSSENHKQVDENN